eukprot:Pgem_evm1s20202
MVNSVVEYVVIAISILLSGSTFTASLPSVYKARMNQHYNKFNPLTYVAMYGHCLGWILWSLFQPTPNVFVLFLCVYGLSLSIWLIITTYLLTTSCKTRILVEVCTILQKKNSSYIYWQLAFAQLINSFFWLAWGLMLDDILFWCPNVLGAIFNIMQLFLACYFPRIKIVHKHNEEKKLVNNISKDIINALQSDRLELEFSNYYGIYCETCDDVDDNDNDKGNIAVVDIGVNKENKKSGGNCSYGASDSELTSLGSSEIMDDFSEKQKMHCQSDDNFNKGNVNNENNVVNVDDSDFEDLVI